MLLGMATISPMTAESASTPSLIAGIKHQGVDLHVDLMQVLMHHILLRCQLGKLLFITLACVGCHVCGHLVLIGKGCNLRCDCLHTAAKMTQF
jgi:hypothetical protein